VEAKLANGNVTAPNLRTAIEKARVANVPNENIERAVKKASEGGDNLESILYEAYGPGGCALMISALTTNRNKAAQEIKFILSKHNLELAGIGSAAWAFSKQGMEWVPQATVELSEVEGEKLGNLVDDLEENDEVQEVFTNEE